MNDNGILGGLHPFLKLLLLVMLMLTGVLTVTLLGVLAAMPFLGTGILTQLGHGSDNLNLLRYFQLLSHIGLFLVPSLVFAALVSRKPLRLLGANHPPQRLPMVFAALIMLAGVPFVYFLMEVNQQLALPESMAGLEEWMRRTEDAAETLMGRFLLVEGLHLLLFNIVMIAVLPGIGEEFIFRGLVQPLFKKWTGNVHVAVIITAILFSAMHFQFYGFLPRFMLGVMLGYMFVLTNNIWVPVFAHFFNNAGAVTLYYIAANSEAVNAEGLAAAGFSPLMITMSLVLVIIMFVVMMRHSRLPAAHDMHRYTGV